MDCDVLTQSVVDKVKEFQSSGGIIIGDDRLCPAIKPDILVEPYSRSRDASENRSELQKRALALREDLEKRYANYVESSNTDVVTYLRRYGSTDYVFAINDLREFGDYVGHHGLVMENALPSDTELIIKRKGGFVYDLVHGHPVPITQAGDHIHVEAHIEPCDGRLLMITDRAISKLEIDAPEMVFAGGSAVCTISITDEAGKPLDAVLPVKVDILDPDGRPAEFSGFYGAAGGILEIGLDIAPNDVEGIWTVRAKELASGKTATQYIRVKQAN